MAQRVVLHLGCGTSSLPEGWEGWQEVRVDADPVARPDVVASLQELPLGDESADAVYCAHCLEHLTERDVLPALREMHRVLRPGAKASIRVPDLQAAAEAVAEDDCARVLYVSPAGPIRALDMIFGHAGYAAENPLMAHRTGFTATVLSAWLGAAGFTGSVARMEDSCELWAEAEKE